MKVPEVCDYKDVTSDDQIPAISRQVIEKLLANFTEETHTILQKAALLYEESYLQSFRYVFNPATNQFFIKGRCRAEMKKSVQYCVDICINDFQVVCCSQCECAAGMGPSAHCKHVVLLLLAVEDFTKTKTFRTQETCTSKLQAFHQPKKYFGSPKMCKDLHLRNQCIIPKDFDPRPNKFREQPEYSYFFRNVMLNSQLSNTPILQLYAPAFQRAITLDHDYLKQHPEEKFLECEGITSITTTKVCEIVIATKDQSKSSKWHEERSKRLTSSNFGTICKRTAKCNEVKLCRSLILPRPFHSQSVSHGKTYEPVAIARYEEMTGCTVISTGLWISLTHPFLASSPDGLVQPSKIIEVKCPFSARDALISPESVPYLTLDENRCLQLKPNHDYYYQIQGTLFCTDRKKCDLIVFTLKDMQVIEIVRDQYFIDSMVVDLTSFFLVHFRQALIDLLLYKDERMFNFDV